MSDRKRTRPNPQRVKIHRSYTVEEVAGLFGNHKNTVRTWIKEGLPTCDSRRPMLILGQALRDFLQAKRCRHKKTCAPGEIYCVRCRVPRRPAGDMGDYTPVTDKFGNLAGICPVCDCLMNRRVSRAKIGLVKGKLDITFAQGQRHIGETGKPFVICDFGEEANHHDKA